MAQESEFVATPDVQLHVVRDGPADGSPVILLHGFPEFWYGWRHQIQPLADAGCRVHVPDLRGYNRSDRPRSVEAYRMDQLVSDALALIQATGHERVHMVGHDWGAVLVWWIAALHPERLLGVMIMNVPHPSLFQAYLWKHPRQMIKSWYIGWFQIPWLPERILRTGNFWALRTMLRFSSREGTFTDRDLERYCSAWSRPGALRGMIHWYRALLRHPPRPLADPVIHVPVRMLWGVKDIALESELAHRSMEWCERGELEWFPEATHWLPQEEPEEVNGRILNFLEETT